MSTWGKWHYKVSEILGIATYTPQVMHLPILVGVICSRVFQTRCYSINPRASDLISRPLGIVHFRCLTTNIIGFTDTFMSSASLRLQSMLAALPVTWTLPSRDASIIANAPVSMISEGQSESGTFLQLCQKENKSVYHLVVTGLYYVFPLRWPSNAPQVGATLPCGSNG